MRRALDIVRGVMHQPRVLFLDEPTTGLDLPNRRRIWRFIERLRARTGMTVLLTTHYLEEADGCDQVAFIRKGRLVRVRRAAAAGRASRPAHDGGRRAATSTRLVAILEPRLGTCLRDGDIAMFRYADEDMRAIAAAAGRARLEGLGAARQAAEPERRVSLDRGREGRSS